MSFIIITGVMLVFLISIFTAGYNHPPSSRKK